MLFITQNAQETLLQGRKETGKIPTTIWEGTVVLQSILKSG